MSSIMFEGETINIGPTPALVKFCGFKGPEEVTSLATRCSRGVPYMRMDDVADWFRANVPQK